jgi:hypothetical protein
MFFETKRFKKTAARTAVKDPTLSLIVSSIKFIFFLEKKQ